MIDFGRCSGDRLPSSRNSYGLLGSAERSQRVPRHFQNLLFARANRKFSKCLHLMNRIGEQHGIGVYDRQADRTRSVCRRSVCVAEVNQSQGRRASALFFHARRLPIVVLEQILAYTSKFFVGERSRRTVHVKRIGASVFEELSSLNDREGMRNRRSSI